MAIQLVRVAAGVRDVASGQLADAITVADAATSAALSEGIYRIVATTKSVVRINGTPATNGEIWPADTIEYRWIGAGYVVSCAAG